ncbi:hypothetical protein [Moraxella oblonga]|uniref:hypothetical protein n=1 Tax=Moraxella oblonga TaxID=200413 RepID=UPI00082FD832|nr:hypothetical protein [Moraxella oblonga]
MNDVVILTRDNFDEVLTQIKNCDNPENLPIIQTNLVRPIMTFRLFWFLMVVMGGLFVLLSNLIQGHFDIFIIVFFIIWFSISGLFLTFEIKNYKIKAFWDKTTDNFYCQLTPEYFIYRFNDNEIKLAWQKIFEISYVRGSQNTQRHLLITPRADDIRIYDSHTFLEIKSLVELFRNYHHKICPPNPQIPPVSLFGFKL